MTASKDIDQTQQAHREKQSVALSSVLAAVFLTTIKIVVGVATGSLGILSEAAHSGLDLAAAAITYFAVRISARPPDREHAYGHGKIENLSALFETLLLLVTCVWIIYEATQRLFFKHVEVEASTWAFVIMATSIIVDISRSRALMRTAKKYNSQALEADALHFSTDVWSSSVVIAGLFMVKVAEWLNVGWLIKADAVAAMGVAGIVIYVSWQLGRKTIADLLDEIPPGIRDEVTRAARVPGVVSVKQARVRRSGPSYFADITLSIHRQTALERAHDITSEVENSIHQVLPGADVLVNIIPVASHDEGIITKTRLLASRQGLGVHGIRTYEVDGKKSMELHLEVSDAISLEEAHDQATAFEKALRQEIHNLEEVVTHIEPTGEATVTRQGLPADDGQIMDMLQEVFADMDVHCHPHELKVQRIAGELSMSFHCIMDGDIPIADVHTLTERIEGVMRTQIPNLGRVVIHVEPENAEAA